MVGLYLAPLANAVVFAMDEKPQIQALERTTPVRPMVPGTPERRSFETPSPGVSSAREAPPVAPVKPRPPAARPSPTPLPRGESP